MFTRSCYKTREKRKKQTKVLPKITRFQDNGQKSPGQLFPLKFIAKYRKCFVSFRNSVGVDAAREKKSWRRKANVKAVPFNVYKTLAPRLRCYFWIFAGRGSARYQHFLSTIHLQGIWLNITTCKLTTTYVQHWSME